MDIEILELCKENIQPLKKGRKASQLRLALQAEVNSELQEKLLKEREEYEISIMNYEGSDPLQPRIDFVMWMEQTYIKHGRDCNLMPLLEDTITLFKDNEDYKQDHRFIELIVKYVENQENAVELFQMVYSQGLGTMCSILYRVWAEVLDLTNDWKRADQVYQLGIANHAQPLEILKEAHSQFQLSVGRRMMLSGGDQPHIYADEPSKRKTLGKLKKGVGSVRNAHGAAGVLTVRQNKGETKKKIAVFQDVENNYEHLISVALQKKQLGSIATSAKNVDENTLKPGTWNKGYNKKEVAKLPPVLCTPFKVHLDPEAEAETPKVPTKTPSNALKTRKADLLPNAMEVFTSTHSEHKGFQGHLELYAGGREFSFEELRAAYYKKRDDHKDWRSGDFKTPAKNQQSTLDPFTPFCSSKKELQFQTPLDTTKEFQTPLYSMNELQSSLQAIKSDQDFDRGAKVTEAFLTADDSPVNVVLNSVCSETPLKAPLTSFAPITPSLKGIDLSEFTETPVHSTSQFRPLNFKVGVDDEYVPQSKTTLFPILEETIEGESYSKPMKKAFSQARKKQLFVDESEVVEKKEAPLKSKFSIFVDDC